MTNRIILRAATRASIALALIALSTGWDTRSGFIATSQGLSISDSPSPTLAALVPLTRHQLSRTGVFKPGSQAAPHLLAMPKVVHEPHLAIGERPFSADSFNSRLHPDTSLSGRAPPLA